MNTRSFLPPSGISNYVSSILVIENMNNHEPFTLPLYANGSPTLIFHTSKARQQEKNIDNLTLYGQTIQAAELVLNKSFTFIAYFLHPHALISLLGIQAKELTDDRIDFNYLQQAKKINLQEQLLNLTGIEYRLSLINQFILELSKINTADASKILFATTELKQNTGADALTALQQKLNTSERSLQRLFEENVGISPKLFKRVCQFHNAFQQLNHHQYTTLTNLAYEHGFADQSHFTRVFKEFTGLTPKGYLLKSAPYNPKF